jgi:hypothetical protein
MSVECDCPFCPIEEYNTEFSNSLLIIHSTKKGRPIEIIKVMGSLDNIPDKVKQACLTLVMYSRNNMKLKVNSSIMLRDNICVDFQEKKLNNKENILEEYFKVCYHPN